MESTGEPQTNLILLLVNMREDLSYWTDTGQVPALGLTLRH